MTTAIFVVIIIVLLASNYALITSDRYRIMWQDILRAIMKALRKQKEEG